MPQPRPRYTDGTTTVSTQLLAFNGGTLSIVSGVPTLTISGGGGGTSDHALLSHLSWSSSGHTGTANRVAGFDGTGATAYLTGSTVVGYVATTAGDLVYGDGAGGATRLPIGSANRLLSSSGTAPQWSTPSDVRALLDLEIGVDVQAYDAGLTSLTAADASAGLPYVTAANTWSTATYSSMLSVVSGAWKVVGLRESGGTDLSIGAIGTGVLVGRGATSALDGVTVSSPLALSGGALSVGDASTSAKGVVQLAGDIAGTATSVTVTQARGLRETAGPTTLSMGAVSDGQVLKRSGSNVIGFSIAGSTVTDLLLLGRGDGHSGAVTFDGTTAVSGFSLASRVYTRNDTTNSLEYSTMTLSVSGGDVTVVTKGLPIKAQVVTGAGTGNFYFDFSGSAASGTTAGTGAAPLVNAPYYGGGTGGAGRSSTGAGNAGAAVTSGVVMGGLGGHGGATGAAAGGSAPTPSRSYTGYYGPLIDIATSMSARLLGNPYSIYPLWGGIGGGGGAHAVVTGSGTSGAGGGGGGVQSIGFGSVTLNSVTLYIRADGAAGSNSAVTSAGDNSFGGGQGGSGGMCVVTAVSVSGTWYVQARGGAGGNGAGGASNNYAGGDGGGGGRVVVFHAGTAPTTDVSGGVKGTSQGTPFVAAADGAAGTAVVVAL